MPLGRVNRLLQRLLSLKGNAPTPELAPELVAAIVLENDRPEYRFLEGSQLCAGAVALGAGGAGFRSEVQLFNPVGSNVLIVLERVRAWTSNCNTISLAPTTTAYANAAATARRRDTRATADSTAAAVGIVGQVRYKNNSAIVAIDTQEFLGGLVAAGTQAYGAIDHAEYIIAPGWGISVVADVDNANLRCSFVWRERGLETSEAR